MNFDVTEANRRISNTIQLGVIDSVDYATGKARVKIGEILTSELPMVTTRAGQDRAWWPYEPGEQVCVFAPSGNLSAGVIMGALFGGAAGANGNSAVSATAWPYASRLDGWLKRHGMRSSMPLCGWPSRMARRVAAI